MAYILKKEPRVRVRTDERSDLPDRIKLRITIDFIGTHSEASDVLARYGLPDLPDETPTG